jgi:hypothetical protein
MKSINQISLDEKVFRASHFLREDDGTTPFDLPSEDYDFEHESFKTITLIEEVHAAFESHTAMARLFFMENIDDATFRSLKMTLNSLVRGKDRNEIAELDQTILALGIHMRTHPAYERFYNADNRKANFDALLEEMSSSPNSSFDCRTGHSLDAMTEVS